ncbi:MAG TPA: hypothetical protein DDW94_06115 [Deltaproteobacteria bacterium]|nr:MAG: hypothetical protein A2Z79_00645 [Deltaproteobacteria bacterium GWA2_55_82]OGQ64886.1 MAG: hypothetical protein A3I81_04755 [Deltaproteobacteria bacterium RIFCSPLOWO2_02_FULL_55_12]OIJ73953.1 MAG: hypothetical protein A2V21_306550 [Deltaproteobacteria bacterium GWC2_55_46]HBG46551.1 hypothetical protein [Deltaproteobacteria bacterium]HCY09953.1 hypothetical protein [Deltaproteobacteria bacterium]
MKRRLFVFMLGCAFAAPLAANAEVTDPLLRKLVDKGTLSATEAEEVQSKKVELPAALKGLSVSGIAFFDFSAGQSASGASAKTDFSRFTLQRGYLNIVKEITPWMRARMTTDIKSGTTVTGDYTVRMKYLYADFLTPDMGPLTNTDIRAGLGHTTYLDFEESINGYRMQGSMFEDKRGLITSSDLGVSVQGYLAGKLSKEQTAEVGSGSYAGRYGSYHIGVYNGGGYSATGETNKDKSVQGRLTVRPLPDALPGLQLTYFGIVGRGNATDAATGKPQQWTNNTGLVTYQHKYATATAEVYSGKGAFNGDTSSAKEKEGYSLFAKVALPTYDQVAFFGRYDSFDPNKDASDDRITTTIGGVSYRITGQNYIVAAYEKTHDETKAYDDKKGQVVLQVAF